MTHRHGARAAIVLAALPTLILTGMAPAQAATGNEVAVNSCTSTAGIYAFDVQANRSVLILPCGSSRNPDGQEGGAIGLPDVDRTSISSYTCGRWRTSTGTPSSVVGGPYVKEMGDTSLRFQVKRRTLNGDGPCPTKWETTNF